MKVPAPNFKPWLTPRQNEILELLLDGKSATEISKELFLSLKTVEKVISNLIFIFKCGTKSRLIIKILRKEELVLDKKLSSAGKKRERTLKIAQLLKLGYSSSAIAEELGIWHPEVWKIIKEIRDFIDNAKSA